MPVSTRYTVTLSDALAKTIKAVADDSSISEGDVLLKALQLYLAAREATKNGLKVGLATQETELETEIVGL